MSRAKKEKALGLYLYYMSKGTTPASKKDADLIKRYLQQSTTKNWR